MVKKKKASALKKSNVAPDREEVVTYLKGLRDSICAGFQKLESSANKFQRTSWQYSKGKGGGEMSVLRGKTFEKAAVNWSGVEGDNFPGSTGKKKEPFFATGVSVITHMANPKA